MLHSTLLAAFASFLSPQADEWPQFGGPERNGVALAPETDFNWGEDGPEELWRLPIGAGYGGAAIEGGEVFLFDRDGAEGDILRVFDLQSGEEKWSVGYEAPGRLNFPGSRTVPTVTADMIYACGGLGHVVAIDRESHEIAWMYDMEEVFGGIEPMFGWSAAPLVIDGLVIVTPLGEDVGLVALDGKSGDEAWVTQAVGHSHSTPALLKLLGKEQVLFLSTENRASGQDAPSTTRISSFDPATGDMLWQTETMLTRLPIPPPLQIDEERFFLTSGYRGGSTLMSIAKDGGSFAFEELFHIDRGAQVHQALRHGDYLYVIVNENWNDPRPRRKEGGLMCLSLEGEEMWRTGDAPYLGRGNALLAGDHLIIQDGRSGVLRIVDATPEEYREVASVDLFGVGDRTDKQMWAPMALAGRLLVLRSQEELVCVRL